jgi:hypothetical protein
MCTLANNLGSAKPSTSQQTHFSFLLCVFPSLSYLFIYLFINYGEHQGLSERMPQLCTRCQNHIVSFQVLPQVHIHVLYTLIGTTGSTKLLHKIVQIVHCTMMSGWEAELGQCALVWGWIQEVPISNSQKVSIRSQYQHHTWVIKALLNFEVRFGVLNVQKKRKYNQREKFESFLSGWNRTP